ncbi:MAG: hypothetical protein AAGA53_11905 [Pseudomonadota bacterium]
MSVQAGQRPQKRDPLQQASDRYATLLANYMQSEIHDLNHPTGKSRNDNDPSVNGVSRNKMVKELMAARGNLVSLNLASGNPKSISEIDEAATLSAIKMVKKNGYTFSSHTEFPPVPLNDGFKKQANGHRTFQHRNQDYEDRVLANSLLNRALNHHKRMQKDRSQDFQNTRQREPSYSR